MSSLHHELQAGLYDEPLATFDSAKGSLLDRGRRESLRVLPASSYSQRVAVVPGEFGPFPLPQGTPILGGFEEKTIAPPDASKRLIIRGYAIMGGLEARN